MFYYILTIVPLAYGCYHFCSRRRIEDIGYRMAWKAITAYSIIENHCADILPRRAPTKFTSTKILQNHKTYTLHDISSNNYQIVKKLPNDLEKYDWGFLKKKCPTQMKCFIFQDFSEIPEFIVTKPFFLEIILEQNGFKHEIHEYLDFFYLAGNKILDNKFLKWYMYYFYEIVLANNYKLHIIDDSVNLITLDQNNYILLTEKDYLKK